jgi:Ca2+-transporting ATPase
VIDPVCSLVFEAERDEDNIMRRPPRKPGEPLFSFSMVSWSLFQGIVAFVMLATVFVVETRLGMPDIELRALIFFALVAEVLALILVNRSFSASLGQALVRHNNALRYVFVAVLLITGAILFWPRAQLLLKFGSIAWADMALAAGLGVVLLIVLEVCKPIVGRVLARLRPVSGGEVESVTVR